MFRNETIALKLRVFTSLSRAFHFLSFFLLIEHRTTRTMKVLRNIEQEKNLWRKDEELLNRTNHQNTFRMLKHEKWNLLRCSWERWEFGVKLGYIQKVRVARENADKGNKYCFYLLLLRVGVVKTYFIRRWRSSKTLRVIS